MKTSANMFCPSFEMPRFYFYDENTLVNILESILETSALPFQYENEQREIIIKIGKKTYAQLIYNKSAKLEYSPSEEEPDKLY